MYQLLFVIHGMGAGNRPADDADWWMDIVQSLRGYAKPHGHERDFVLRSPRAGQVLIVPLTYHDWFDDVRKKWKQENGNEVGWIPILQQLIAGDPAVAARVPAWVQTAGTFFWTHVLDVLLYRYISDFTIPIRESVALQIAEAWHKADIDNGVRTPAHFVAHSLGTAVLHDSICLLAADPAFGTGTHSIDSLVTLANVSPVLENGNPTYGSADRTVNCPAPPTGMTEAYFAFRHELDPIAAVKKFDASANGWPASDFLGQVLFDVKDWNVHGYTHYLDNPAAHFRLLERLWGDEDWPTRLQPAVAAYEAKPGTPCPQAIAEARERLRAIINTPRPQTLMEFLDVVVGTVAVLRDAGAACDLEQP